MDQYLSRSRPGSREGNELSAASHEGFRWPSLVELGASTASSRFVSKTVGHLPSFSALSRSPVELAASPASRARGFTVLHLFESTEPGSCLLADSLGFFVGPFGNHAVVSLLSLLAGVWHSLSVPCCLSLWGNTADKVVYTPETLLVLGCALLLGQCSGEGKC